MCCDNMCSFLGLIRLLPLDSTLSDSPLFTGGGLARRPPWLDGGTPPPAGWRTPTPPRLDGEPPPGWMEEPPHLDGELPPPDGGPPPGSGLRHTVYDRLVRILLECILVQVCVFASKISMFIELK